MIAVVKLRILPPMDIVMDAVQDACEEVLDAYREHVQSGEKMDTDDAVMIRSLTDKIVVYDDRMEILSIPREIAHLDRLN